METIVNIENNNLANYIMFKLDKLDNVFTIKELNQITEVVIDCNEETNTFELFEELLYLNHLKTITIRNGYIYNDTFKVLLGLNNLDEIVFENCEFENADLIIKLKLKSLSLINSRINNYSFISYLKELRELTIVNGSIDIKKINKLKYLRYLQLSYSNILDITPICIDSLEELYVDNTNLTNFKFINRLHNLKRVSIDENQYVNNKKIFDNLVNKGILVLNENMVEFGDETNEE